MKNPFSITLVGESCSGKSSIIKSFITKTPTLIENTGTDYYCQLWLSILHANMRIYCYCI